MELVTSQKLFDGQQQQYTHQAESVNCEMTFSIYLPPQADTQPVPVLYWLSGLTCTDQNFVTKSGAQQFAAKHGVAIVCPDTSPRGAEVPDDPEQAWDFGLGAGFYVNATQSPWKQYYQMYDYVVQELPRLVEKKFAVTTQRAISGHSMGGHGALTIALKNPERYRSMSAFSPIAAPINCPWGQKALGLYLGDDQEKWKDYDSCELIKVSSNAVPGLVDQGSADDFLQQQLNTQQLIDTVSRANYPMQVRMQPGYDHSYFFIATFIEQHIAFHAKHFDNT
ncbi:S-formylglutathione hydrolase [Arenicella xantha]|uniref:S-formylglutathione hydrolase n=1 Tax=Arenicella xantha TaxID=644221 RepID=A0A395JSF9_9GAMM|nr:S-formylglutathione hydrolase [Arenicella xantha]RBP51640.1 S-formylglutathione hydrolase [Arenicella xantha]